MIFFQLSSTGKYPLELGAVNTFSLQDRKTEPIVVTLLRPNDSGYGSRSFQLSGADHYQVAGTCAQILPPESVFIPQYSSLQGLIASLPVDGAPSFPEFPLRCLHAAASPKTVGILCTDIRSLFKGKRCIRRWCAVIQKKKKKALIRLNKRPQVSKNRA